MVAVELTVQGPPTSAVPHPVVGVRVKESCASAVVAGGGGVVDPPVVVMVTGAEVTTLPNGSVALTR